MAIERTLTMKPRMIREATIGGVLYRFLKIADGTLKRLSRTGSDLRESDEAGWLQAEKEAR